MKHALAGVSLASLAFLAVSARADIIITGGWLNTTASASIFGSGAAYDQAVNTPANVLQTTANASFQSVTNATTYDFNVAGNAGHVQSSFLWNAPAVADQYGAPHNQGSIDFQVTGPDPVTYYLSGDLANLGGSNLSMVVGLRAGKSSLFENDQVSHGTGSESFVLGGTGGDFSNVLTGGMTGVLTAGSYNFTYSIYTQTDLGAATATDGFLRLDFGAPAPAPEAVPEPSTFAFMGLGLIGLFAARRKAKA